MCWLLRNMSIFNKVLKHVTIVDLRRQYWIKYMLRHPLASVIGCSALSAIHCVFLYCLLQLIDTVFEKKSCGGEGQERIKPLT